MSNLYSNSIFWIEVEKIKPNPYQPRREFDENALKDLSDSIRQYGVLQPLVVSRIEHEREDGGLFVEYELIAGERRLRASKLAKLEQVPVIIRTGDDSMMKLEIAIIENLQREDLNVVDRARAFLRLAEEFKFTHAQIGQKVGKSREYVSNSLRVLSLPQEVLDALSKGQISEGHTRPIMMLNTRPDEQMVLFKEILYKKITVREAERLARRVAVDKVRKKELLPDPEILEMEEKLRDTLGTRVHIERNENGGHVTIDFFSPDDLLAIVSVIETLPQKTGTTGDMFERFIATKQEVVAPSDVAPEVANSTGQTIPTEVSTVEPTAEDDLTNEIAEDAELRDDRSKEEVKQSEIDTDLYNIKNFSL